MRATGALLTPLGVVPAGPRDPKFKMPSIYRPKNENCFRCKAGYYLTKFGRRERREFRLGDDERVAHKKALALAEAWLKVEQRHLWNRTSFKEVFPDEAASLPVWTGMSQVEEDGRDEYLATPPQDLPGDEEDAPLLSHPLPAVSLKEAAQSLLGRLRNKAGPDAKAMATYRWYEREFALGLVDEAFAPKPPEGQADEHRVVPAVTNFPVTQLTLTHVEHYCEYWCDLSTRDGSRP